MWYWNNQNKNRKTLHLNQIDLQKVESILNLIIMWGKCKLIIYTSKLDYHIAFNDYCHQQKYWEVKQILICMENLMCNNRDNLFFDTFKHHWSPVSSWTALSTNLSTKPVSADFNITGCRCCDSNLKNQEFVFLWEQGLICARGLDKVQLNTDDIKIFIWAG